MPIRVVIADDQQLVRQGIGALLDRADDIVVVAEADDGESAIRAVDEHRPDVALLDVRMPGLDGLEAARAIIADQRLSSTAVVMLTTFDADEYLFEAIRLGASGFLLKDAEPEELRRAVRVVAAGDALLSPAVTRRVMTTAAGAHRPAVNDRDLSPLTEREREVLREVALGHSNDEIATRLYMSPATARTHVSRILTKLRARDRSQLVVAAYEAGIVVPGSAD